jgi:hypothetical protein
MGLRRILAYLRFLRNSPTLFKLIIAQLPIRVGLPDIEIAGEGTSPVSALYVQVAGNNLRPR